MSLALEEQVAEREDFEGCFLVAGVAAGRSLQGHRGLAMRQKESASPGESEWVPQVLVEALEQLMHVKVRSRVKVWSS